MNARRVFARLVTLALSLMSLRGADDPTKMYVYSSGGLISIRSLDGTLLGGFIGAHNPTGIAVDKAGRVYTSANLAGNDINIFNPDGKWAFGINVGRSSGVALDDEGQIYVLCIDGSVRIFSPDGKGGRLIIKPNMEAALGITIAAGKIYIVGNTQNIVKTFTMDGKPSTPTITRNLSSPRMLGVAPDGKLYIGNFIYVGTYQPDGTRIMPNLAHIATDGGPATSTAIAIDPKGRIYVGYDNVGNRKGDVVVFGPDGKQIGPTIKVPDGVSGLVLR